MKKIGSLFLSVLVVVMMAGPGLGTANAGSVFLSWLAPTTNEDGTPLSDLAGYKIYWGTSSGNYPNSAVATRCYSCPDGTSAGGSDWECLVALQPDTTYYFAATAFNTADIESAYSNEVSKTTIPATNPLGNIATSPTSSLCRVDGYDLIAFSKVFGKTILGSACTEANYILWKTTQEKADLNYDGRVDGYDQSILSSNFGKKCATCPCL